jgi:hypothetical protein
MNPHLLNAKNEFWRAYAAVRQSLEKLPAHQLADLQHDAEDQTRQMAMPFSERAAAHLVHAACTELLA